MRTITRFVVKAVLVLAAVLLAVPGSPASRVEAATNTMLPCTLALSETHSVRAPALTFGWSASGSVLLGMDQTGPTVTDVTAYPNPNNGRQGASPITPALRVNATVTDPPSGDGGGAPSAIAAVEGFIDALGDPGTGFPFMPLDGGFDFFSEQAYAFIQLAAIAALPDGAHPIYVRGRDAAGNWGAPASTMLILDRGKPAGGSAAAISNPRAIFADDFESGSLALWTFSSGAGLSVTASARRSGVYGMQAIVAGHSPAYVADSMPTAEAEVHVRFYFDANRMHTPGGQAAILAGVNSVGTVIFQVQYRGNPSGSGQVRLTVLRSGGITATRWSKITRDGFDAVEIAWTSGTAATASLYVNGTLVQTLTGLDNNAYKLGALRLGPSGGLLSGWSGTLYFDDLIATRTTYIGP